MPFAQKHFPFETNNSDLSSLQVADFIAEGIDQTRGWFYTLLVIGTGILNKSPFKNVIVNGIVQTAQGQKMSKSKKNYTPVEEIMDKYGADSLRLYLLSTPVVKGCDIYFRDNDVKNIHNSYVIMLSNIVEFLFEMIGLYNKSIDSYSYPNYTIGDLENIPRQSLNVMDEWILQCLDKLIIDVNQHMLEYNLSGIVPKLLKFIDQVSKWYMNLNKKRFKDVNVAKTPLDVLSNCLYYFSLISAPFAPFTSESIYQKLREIAPVNNRWHVLQSIHYHTIPTATNNVDKGVIWKSDNNLTELFEYVSDIVDVTRSFRATRNNTSHKFPIECITVVASQSVCDLVSQSSRYLEEELNALNVQFSIHEDIFVSYKLEIDVQKTKLRLEGKKIPMLKNIVSSLNEKQINHIVKYKQLPDDLKNNEIEIVIDELIITKIAKNFGNNNVVVCGKSVVLCFDNTVSQWLIEKYFMKQLNRAYQQARKEAHLSQVDDVMLFFTCEDKLYDIVRRHGFIGTYKGSINVNDTNTDTLLLKTFHTDLGNVILKLVKK